jgi:hypothetical protein
MKKVHILQKIDSRVDPNSKRFAAGAMPGLFLIGGKRIKKCVTITVKAMKVVWENYPGFRPVIKIRIVGEEGIFLQISAVMASLMGEMKTGKRYMLRGEKMSSSGHEVWAIVAKEIGI